MSRWSVFGLIACGRQSRTRTQERKGNSFHRVLGLYILCQTYEIFQMDVNILAQFTTLLQCTLTANEQLHNMSSPNIRVLIRTIMPRGWDGQGIWHEWERSS
jgi:hypothetical protein